MSTEQWRLLLEVLEQARIQRQRVTYRCVLNALALPAPAMRTLAAALELLAQQDTLAGRPLRSALVVSQTGSGLPRAGFFECVQRLGGLPLAATEEEQERWHQSELIRVFDYCYAECDAC